MPARPSERGGELVYVAWARNQAEGEFIQALLLEEGIPSLLRRSAGFDVPDFLAAGPRDVLVPEAALMAAQEVLLQAEFLSLDGTARNGTERRAVVVPARLLLGLLAAFALVLLVVWLGLAVGR